MSVPKYEIRPLRTSEFGQCLKLWLDAGFYKCSHSMYTWFEVDPQGIYGAVSPTGEILGVCAGIIHHDDLSFVGLYTVAKQHRGKGIGLRLWDACMDHIGDRNAIVDAVLDKIELYRDRGGFPIEEKRWYTILKRVEIDIKVLSQHVDDVKILPIGVGELPLVLQYDHRLVGYDRKKLISLYIAEEDTASFMAIRDGKCIGYGIYKLGNGGHGILGPLYADNQEMAEVLLRWLLGAFADIKSFEFTAIKSNDTFLLDKLHVISTIGGARLYSKHVENVDINKIFAFMDLSFSPF